MYIVFVSCQDPSRQTSDICGVCTEYLGYNTPTAPPTDMTDTIVIMTIIIRMIAVIIKIRLA